MAAYSGARRSEIAALTKDDIKLCPDTKRYYFVVKEGKTKAARRTVPIHNHLIELGLLEWIDSSNYRFFNTAYENLNRVTDLFGSILERNVNDHGERLVFHSLRHTFITKARAAGINNVLVQQVVGHEKYGAGQTDRYTHTFQLKDVLKVVDCIQYPQNALRDPLILFLLQDEPRVAETNSVRLDQDVTNFSFLEAALSVMYVMPCLFFSEYRQYDPLIGFQQT